MYWFSQMSCATSPSVFRRMHLKISTFQNIIYEYIHQRLYLIQKIQALMQRNGVWKFWYNWLKRTWRLHALLQIDKKEQDFLKFLWNCLFDEKLKLDETRSNSDRRTDIEQTMQQIYKCNLFSYCILRLIRNHFLFHMYVLLPSPRNSLPRV